MVVVGERAEERNKLWKKNLEPKTNGLHRQSKYLLI